MDDKRCPASGDCPYTQGAPGFLHRLVRNVRRECPLGNGVPRYRCYEACEWWLYTLNIIWIVEVHSTTRDILRIGTAFTLVSFSDLVSTEMLGSDIQFGLSHFLQWYHFGPQGVLFQSSLAAMACGFGFLRACNVR